MDFLGKITSNKLVFFSLVSVSVILRLLLFQGESYDMIHYLGNWYNFLKSEGFSGFSKSFSDYPPLYLYYIYFLASCNIDLKIGVKTLSVIFDFLLALVVSLVVKEVTKNEILGKSSFLVFLFVPTVFINSSWWGQSDAIYTFFVIFSIYWFIRERYLIAMLSYSFAFALKLQSVFILPLIGILLFRKIIYDKDFKLIFYPLIIPLVYIISIIPSYLAGRDLVDLLTIYLFQANQYDKIVMGAPNIYQFVPVYFYENKTFVDLLTYLGIFITFIVVFSLFIFFVFFSQKLDADKIIKVSLLFALVIPFLLPRMHERYFYMADVLSIIFAFVFPDKWYYSLVFVLSSLISYWGMHIPFSVFGMEFVIGLYLVSLVFGGFILRYSILAVGYPSFLRD